MIELVDKNNMASWMNLSWKERRQWNRRNKRFEMELRNNVQILYAYDMSEGGNTGFYRGITVFMRTLKDGQTTEWKRFGEYSDIPDQYNGDKNSNEAMNRDINELFSDNILLEEFLFS